MKSKKVIAAFLALVLAFGLCPAPALAQGGGDVLAAGTPATLQVQALKSGKVKKSATKKMRAQYKSVLAKARSGKGKFKTFKQKGGRYYSCYGYLLYDIDNNGSPELLVNAGSYSVNTAWFVFRMKGGKAQYAGRFGDGQTTVAKGKGKKLYAVRAHMGAVTIDLVKLKSGKVKTVNKAASSNAFSKSAATAKFVKAQKLTYPKHVASYDTSAIDKAKVKKK